MGSRYMPHTSARRNLCDSHLVFTCKPMPKTQLLDQWKPNRHGLALGHSKAVSSVFLHGQAERVCSAPVTKLVNS